MAGTVIGPSGVRAYSAADLRRLRTVRVLPRRRVPPLRPPWEWRHLLRPRPALWNSISVVQSLTPTHSSGNTTAFTSGAFGSSVTGGNTLLVAVWYEGSAVNPSVSSVTDNVSGSPNTYVKDATVTAPNSLDVCDVWRASNVTGGASFDFTVNLSNSIVTVTALEVSGLANASPLDGSGSTNSGAAGTGGSPSTGTFSTTNANDLLLCTFAGGFVKSDNVTTVPSGFTDDQQVNNSTIEGGDLCHKIVSATQTGIDPTWSCTDNAGAWAAIALAYKATGAAPVPNRIVTAQQAVAGAAYF